MAGTTGQSNLSGAERAYVAELKYQQALIRLRMAVHEEFRQMGESETEARAFTDALTALGSLLDQSEVRAEGLGVLARSPVEHVG